LTHEKSVACFVTIRAPGLLLFAPNLNPIAACFILAFELGRAAVINAVVLFVL
jgi:hypothetical protein